ncbi:MAG: NAD-dependent epimerase/dehydratase family protein [Candidatus Omnitrophota bacterium]|jgi:nucleoside-diphosphate-sugar epimerase
MRCLITGATGFIGRQLAVRLISKGHIVRLLLRGKDKLPPEFDQRDIRIGDITVRESLEGMCDSIDVVFHCAGLLGGFSVPKLEYSRVNVSGTQNVIKEAKKAAVKKFVFISSAGVIGPTGDLPAHEGSPCFPSNDYERSKLLAERLVVESGLNYVIIRPEFVYGKEDLHVLELFRAIQKRRFLIIGSGSSILHPTYIDDLITALTLCLAENVKNQIYLIAGPEHVTVKEFTQSIATMVGAHLLNFKVPVWLAMILAGVNESFAHLLGREPLVTFQRVNFFTKSRAFNTSKSALSLLFRPRVKLQEGLIETIKFYRSRGYLK